MSGRQRTKLVREKDYAAEVTVDLVETPGMGASPVPGRCRETRCRSRGSERGRPGNGTEVRSCISPDPGQRCLTATQAARRGGLRGHIELPSGGLIDW